MSQEALDNFGAYRKAMELFDLVVQDMEALRHDPRCWKLISQQVASADSICSNIEEVYGKSSSVEYARYLDISRGSARETRGRYLRLKHWLANDLILQRTGLLDEIIGILTKSIITLRSAPRLKEDTVTYETA